MVSASNYGVIIYLDIEGIDFNGMELVECVAAYFLCVVCIGDGESGIREVIFLCFFVEFVEFFFEYVEI